MKPALIDTHNRWQQRHQIISTLEAITEGVKSGKYSSLVVLAAGEDFDSVVFCEDTDIFTLVGLLESCKLELLSEEVRGHDEEISS